MNKWLSVLTVKLQTLFGKKIQLEEDGGWLTPQGFFIYALQPRKGWENTLPEGSKRVSFAAMGLKRLTPVETAFRNEWKTKDE